jgi:hypothetical protein
MPPKNSKKSKNKWDIVDVMSPTQDLTESQKNPRKHQRAHSPFSAAVLVLGFASTLPSIITVPGVESTSHIVSVVHRVPRQRTVRPTRPSRTNAVLDFAKARSGESLARAFDTYFKPADPEADSDETCFI